MQAEWHAGWLMAPLADMDATADNMRQGCRRLDKVKRLWSGSPVPLASAHAAILSNNRAANDT